MNELFIIIIVMIVLWFINEHSKNIETYESNDKVTSKKLELSLCELVDILKRLFLSNMQRVSEPVRHQLVREVEPVRHQLVREVEPVRHQLVRDNESARHQLLREVEPVRHQLVRDNESVIHQLVREVEPVKQHLVTENKNMNIIHHVEPHDGSDALTNHSLLNDMQLPYHGHI
jgi:hypothetical protein